MHGPMRRVVTGLVFFLSTLVVAVAGYWSAGWSLLDALYMVVITIFGVGYGEVKPLTSSGLKVFTILVIIAGTSAAVYSVGGFVQLITEGELNRALGARRMTRGIETLKEHVIICGFGRIGQTLARELQVAKRAFVIIDRDPERVAQAEACGYWVRLGDATEEEVLQSVRIEQAAVLTTVLRSDASNVFITLTARGVNPRLTIIARGENLSTEKKLLQAGADHVVMPTVIGGTQMAHLITHPAAVDFLEQKVSRGWLNEQLAQLDLQVVDLDISAGSPLIGQNLGHLEVRGKNLFLIVAVKQASGETHTQPTRGLVLQEGDRVIVLGRQSDMPQFVQRYPVQRQIKYRGAGA